MKTWTVQQMIDERPCYDLTRIQELAAGKTQMSLLEILQLDIPAADKVWVICRPGALTPEQQKLWLEKIVTRAITNHVIGCGIPEVEAWGRAWLSGEDRTAEAAEAAAAARGAAWGAARDAAWAAWYAAAAATEATAVAAAWNAAGTGTGTGTGARTAEVAERILQVNDCIEILKGIE